MGVAAEGKDQPSECQRPGLKNLHSADPSADPPQLPAPARSTPAASNPGNGKPEKRSLAGIRSRLVCKSQGANSILTRNSSTITMDRIISKEHSACASHFPVALCPVLPGAGVLTCWEGNVNFGLLTDS